MQLSKFLHKRKKKKRIVRKKKEEEERIMATELPKMQGRKEKKNCGSPKLEKKKKKGNGQWSCQNCGLP